MRERRFGDLSVGEKFTYAGNTLKKKSDTEAETVDGENLFFFESRNMVRQEENAATPQGNGSTDAVYRTINGTLIAAFSLCIRTIEEIKKAAIAVMNLFQTQNQIRNFSVFVDLYQNNHNDVFLVKIFYENASGNSFTISRSL